MSESDPEVYGYDPSPPSLSWAADAAKTPARLEAEAVARVRRFLSMFVGPNDIIAETSLHFDGEPIPLRAADLRRALAAPRISEAVLALAAAAYRLGAEVGDPIPDHAVRKQYLGEIVRAEEALSTEDRLLLSSIAPPPVEPKEATRG